jgi:hypothetical protein
MSGSPLSLHAAWDDPQVGGLLDAEAKARALASLGKTAGLVRFADMRPGVTGQDEPAALIGMTTPDGKQRWVWPVLQAARVPNRPVVRLRPDGVTRVAGSGQGFFKVPKDTLGRVRRRHPFPVPRRKSQGRA